jgi:hypothetical protein
MRLPSVWAKEGQIGELPLITAFFDESGHSGSSRIVAMGGAIGSPMMWRPFREQWTATLDRFGVKVFHMADFESAWGEFRGWSTKRRQELLDQLLSCLDNKLIFFLGTSVVVSDFRNLTARFRRCALDPWYICFQLSIQQALGEVFVLTTEDLWNPKRVAIFFERQMEFRRAPIMFASMLDLPSIADRIFMVGFAGKNAAPELQLADLVAYEVRKHIENSFFDPSRPTRWPMRRLTQILGISVNVFDERGRWIKAENVTHGVFRSAQTSLLEKNQPIKLVPQTMGGNE